MKKIILILTVLLFCGCANVSEPATDTQVSAPTPSSQNRGQSAQHSLLSDASPESQYKMLALIASIADREIENERGTPADGITMDRIHSDKNNLIYDYTIYDDSMSPDILHTISELVVNELLCGGEYAYIFTSLNVVAVFNFTYKTPANSEKVSFEFPTANCPEAK